jgi:fermentation-respiration switch protein FrsA (DUF1100 family)
MRKDIEFKAEDGTLLHSWHYLPDHRAGKVPIVVMAHCLASVKEMYLDKYAELFAQSGIASLFYDHQRATQVAKANEALRGCLDALASVRETG